MARPPKEQSIKNIEKLYRSLLTEKGEPCAYCGMLSSDQEHVTPISYIKTMRELKRQGLKIKVPEVTIVQACRECNLIATNFIFKNFAEKKSFIKAKLITKCRKLLKVDPWDDEQLEQLGGRMKEEVFFFNEFVKLIKKRIEW